MKNKKLSSEQALIKAQEANIKVQADSLQYLEAKFIESKTDLAEFYKLKDILQMVKDQRFNISQRLAEMEQVYLLEYSEDLTKAEKKQHKDTMEIVRYLLDNL